MYCKKVKIWKIIEDCVKFGIWNKIMVDKVFLVWGFNEKLNVWIDEKRKLN